MASGEVQCVEIRLRQVVPSGNVALCLRFRKGGKLGHGVVLPCPGHDGPQVFAGFIRSAARIGATVLGSLVMHPIQKIANVGSVDLVDIDFGGPSRPFGDGRLVFLACPAGEFFGSEVLCCDRFNADRHGDNSKAVDLSPQCLAPPPADGR